MRQTVLNRYSIKHDAQPKAPLYGSGESARMLRLRDALAAGYSLSEKGTKTLDEEVVPDVIKEGVASFIGQSDLYLLPNVDVSKNPNEASSSVFRTDAPGGLNAIEPLCKRTKRESNLEHRANALNPVAAKTLTKTCAIPNSETSSTKGGKATPLAKWFGLPEKKLTPEVVRELKALQLRGSADPKRFFKSTDMKQLPTHFHFATVARASSIESVGEDTELFNDERKRKPRSLVSSLLRNDAVQSFARRKAVAACAVGCSGNKKSYRDRVASKAHRKRR